MALYFKSSVQDLLGYFPKHLHAECMNSECFYIFCMFFAKIIDVSGAAAAAAAAAAAMYIPNAAAAQTYHQLTPPVSPHNSLLYGQPNFTAVKMKGLPTDATVQDVMTFFSDYIVSQIGKIILLLLTRTAPLLSCLFQI